MFSVSLLMHCFLQNLACHVFPGLCGSAWLFLSWGTAGSSYLCFLQHGPVCSGLHCSTFALFWFQLQISAVKKSLYDVASATSIYHHMLMTDGIATLLGIYMKKRGIDLSSLASSLWEFTPAMASTTLVLPAQITLLLVTTVFLLKLHELCACVKPPSSSEIQHHKMGSNLSFFPREMLHSSYAVVTYVDDEFLSL